jgi:hypothetical protein
MLRIISVALLGLFLSGCATGNIGATLSSDFAKIRQVYTAATTSTVPADVVRPAAATFDILKGTAANFAVYCVSNHFTPPGCDVGTRRKISRAIKSGTKARIQLRASVENGQPAIATIYNLLVGAVTDLQSTPAATFTGG